VPNPSPAPARLPGRGLAAARGRGPCRLRAPRAPGPLRRRPCAHARFLPRAPRGGDGPAAASARCLGPARRPPPCRRCPLELPGAPPHPSHPESPPGPRHCHLEPPGPPGVASRVHPRRGRQSRASPGTHPCFSEGICHQDPRPHPGRPLPHALGSVSPQTLVPRRPRLCGVQCPFSIYLHIKGENEILTEALALDTHFPRQPGHHQASPGVSVPAPPAPASILPAASRTGFPSAFPSETWLRVSPPGLCPAAPRPPPTHENATPRLLSLPGPQVTVSPSCPWAALPAPHLCAAPWGLHISRHVSPPPAVPTPAVLPPRCTATSSVCVPETRAKLVSVPSACSPEPPPDFTQPQGGAQPQQGSLGGPWILDPVDTPQGCPTLQRTGSVTR
jgi:hypothetical protein